MPNGINPTYLNITIYGDTPSKKNSRILSFRGSRPISLPGKNHQAWHRDASKQVLGIPRIETPGRIEMTFYPRTGRAGDLTNKAEAVMDLLVDAGILEDDNWFVCPLVVLKLGAVDKERPRVEIEVAA